MTITVHQQEDRQQRAGGVWDYVSVSRRRSHELQLAYSLACCGRQPPAGAGD
jgi:hypothetical protein